MREKMRKLKLGYWWDEKVTNRNVKYSDKY